MAKTGLTQLQSGEIITYTKGNVPKIWPADKPVPAGMVRTKKGTLITIEKHESLQRARANAEGKTGRKISRNSIQAEAMREALMDQVSKTIKDLIDSQIQSAKGITVMMARKWESNRKTGEEHRTGEYAQVTDPKEIAELLNSDGEGDNYYKIVTKNPSVEAFKVLIEQSIGKPKDHSKDEKQVEPLSVIINNITKGESRSSTVTVVPKQVASSKDDD
jgi:hypothetical protein